MFQCTIVTVFNIVLAFFKSLERNYTEFCICYYSEFSQFQKRSKDEKIPELNFVIFQLLWQSYVFPRKYEEVYERRFEL